MTFNPVPKPQHKRRIPKQSKRNEFSQKVRNQIMKDENGLCQSCGNKATQIHHVRPRGRQGRGVYTNGMAICNSCHTRIHKDNALMNHWILLYEQKYGKDFYKDVFDD